jgi:phosphatidylserine/phosphatidylglycerophosphate/cardiolipin synthase-like enzyme
VGTNNGSSQAGESFSFRVRLCDSPDDKPQIIVVYDWFTRVGTPPRAGNKAEILVDGAQTWASVSRDMQAAKENVKIATWMCRPDIELVRPKELAVTEPEERANYRFGPLLDAKAKQGVRAWVLIWGLTYTPILNSWLRKWYWTPQDRIELMEQDHPKLIGSYHQKTMTIDGRVGYCGGMNVNENDWDTNDHPVFDPRRNPHRTRQAFRRLVQEKKNQTKFLPRHDLTIRFEGPVVRDLSLNFTERWNQCVEAQRTSLCGRFWTWVRHLLGHRSARKLHLPAEPETLPPDLAGGRLAQIARTTPQGEEGILDLYRRAIRNARRYIYIENQYFRSPTLGEELAKACRKNPKLRLIALVWPINDGGKSLIDPSAYWTAKTQDAIRQVRPDFQLTRLLSADRGADGNVQYVTVDMHAKVLIVDDVWLTVGSANINERGFKYEAEINAAILDRETARNLRVRLMGEHLKIPDQEVESKLGDVDAAFDLWEEHCAANEKARANGQVAASNVHHFVQKSYNFPAFWVGSGIF